MRRSACEKERGQTEGEENCCSDHERSRSIDWPRLVHLLATELHCVFNESEESEKGQSVRGSAEHRILDAVRCSLRMIFYGEEPRKHPRIQLHKRHAGSE